jgi:predicted MFS family arabinose efflux permease
MLKPTIDKKAFKRSTLSSFSKLIGIGLGAGAGDLVHRMVGDGFSGWSVALLLAATSFILILIAEYEREKG